MWTSLWNSLIAPKIRLFMWKAACNWLACKANLFRRKCAPNPMCPICASASETIEHMLFHCPWVKAMWFGSGKAFWVLQKDIVAVDKWLEDLLCGCLSKESEREDVGLIFQICWAIWKDRNRCVFNDKNPRPEVVIEQARGANVDYLQTVCDKMQMDSTIRSRVERWSLPPPSVLKINCDGVFKSSCSLAAFGIIARDSGGSAHDWRSGRVMVSSALMIEA
ncbi:uncharacterized protein LOC131321203 [Rhododendron vialii]|uniref:uncharacterized protein LOC131321203 n=1 Tax=Rhododendron vialii TaxID=182163 RepID=UPI00265E8698|nr:uncharacterized protein LOC131321203 [Rhododendron vialii]